MRKLAAFIIKDFKILYRDKLGLIFMFMMPIILAIVIAAVQNSSFELVNNNKIPLIINNKDTGLLSQKLVAAIKEIGLFKINYETPDSNEKTIIAKMNSKDALVAIVIPNGFSENLQTKSKILAAATLKNLGLKSDSISSKLSGIDDISFFYSPVLQASFRQSINGSLQTAIQIVQTKNILDHIYNNINGNFPPDSLNYINKSSTFLINEIPISRDGNKTIPNATQHNIPAWTIFAMFFVVISLGSSVVREKLSGSFMRLRTLPTHYFFSIISKQFTYLVITILQAAVIFSIGIWLFPVIGLPKLIMPNDLFALFIVTFICGWCAVSYAICIGVFAQTQEQSNGIGAVSVVLMAAVGGILVPSFAMPESFQFIMKLSPLHWCLESYYELFLSRGSLKDLIISLIPLLCIILAIHIITIFGLAKKRLI